MTILQKNIRKESQFGNSASLFKKLVDALLTINTLDYYSLCFDQIVLNKLQKSA
jgi:hypothetical protein